MDEYIERRALLAAYDAAHKGKPGGARKLIEDAPAADVVSRSVHKQVQEERDLAIEQLASYGVSHGEKAELEETVVHQRKRADRAETFICKMCAECNWEIRDGMLFMQKSCCSLSPFDCGKFKLRGQDGFGGLTMDNREKLVEIIQISVGGCARNWAEIIADGLIAHGVTLRDVPDNNVGKWIPVSEELPNLIACDAGTAYSEAVNVLTTGQKVLTAIYDGTDFIADAEFWDAEDEEITHWTPVPLPLPQPQKGE